MEIQAGYAADLINELKETAKVRQSKKLMKSKDEVVRPETGELVPLFFQQSTPYIIDTTEFVKRFKNHIKLSELSEKLSKLSIRMLLWLEENAVKGTSEITLVPKTLATELNVRSLDKVYKAIKELLATDIIRKKNPALNLYEINPKIIFNGNRIEFVVRMTGTKEINGWRITEERQITATKG